MEIWGINFSSVLFCGFFCIMSISVFFAFLFFLFLVLPMFYYIHYHGDSLLSLLLYITKNRLFLLELDEIMLMSFIVFIIVRCYLIFGTSIDEQLQWIFTTLSNGSLGSRNDEERSEPRYVLWHVVLVNHCKPWTQCTCLRISLLNRYAPLRMSNAGEVQTRRRWPR